MKIKTYKFIMLFACLFIFLVIDNSILKNNIESKIQTYEKETIEGIDYYIDNLIECKSNSLTQLTRALLDDEKIVTIMNKLSNSDELNDLFIDDVDYVFYKNNGDIYYNINNETENYEFNQEELEGFKEVYDNCIKFVSFYNSKKWIKGQNGYELLFGDVAYDVNYDVYGVVITRITAREIEDYIYKLIDNKKICVKLECDGTNIVMVNENNGSHTIDYELHCNRLDSDFVMKINGRKLCSFYYITNFILIISTVITTTLFFVFIYKSKNKKEMPIIYFNILILLALIICYSGIFTFKVYDDLISKLKINSCIESTIDNLALYQDKYSQLILKVYETINNDIQNSDFDIDDINNYIKNKYNSLLLKSIESFDELGHIYLYDSNRKMVTVPEEKLYNYIQPDEKIYTEYFLHKNAFYYDVVYDDNYKCDAIYFSVPFVKNNKVVLNMTFVFDYDTIKNKILKESKNTSLETIYIDEEYNLYKINNSTIEYEKKYTGVIQEFFGSNWLDESETKQYMLDYVDKYKIESLNAVFTTSLDCVILYSDENKCGWIFIVEKIFLETLFVLLISIFVCIDIVKEKYCEIKIKNKI